MRSFICILSAVGALGLTACDTQDLPKIPEQTPSVVGTSTIAVTDVGGHGVAYNPSVAVYRGQKLLAFRLDAPDLSTQQIAMVALDDAWQPRGRSTVLNTEGNSGAHPTAEDPRLFVLGDDLYVIYNTAMAGGRRMHVGQVLVSQRGDAIDFQLVTRKELIYLKDGKPTSTEKNWTPFDYQGALHFVYQTNPPLVVSVSHADLTGPQDQLVVHVVSRGQHKVDWPYGEMRGGSPALFDPQQQRYVSFFHSRRIFLGPHGKPRNYYVMGMYTFAKDPPFEITQLPTAPLVDRSFYDSPHLWQEIIFPAGLTLTDSQLHVTYGKNDTSMGVVTLDKAQALDELVTPAWIAQPVR